MQCCHLQCIIINLGDPSVKQRTHVRKPVHGLYLLLAVRTPLATTIPHRRYRARAPTCVGPSKQWFPRNSILLCQFITRSMRKCCVLPAVVVHSLLCCCLVAAIPPPPPPHTPSTISPQLETEVRTVLTSTCGHPNPAFHNHNLNLKQHQHQHLSLPWRPQSRSASKCCVIDQLCARAPSISR